jgi:hypothetical protein
VSSEPPCLGAQLLACDVAATRKRACCKCIGKALTPCSAHVPSSLKPNAPGGSKPTSAMRPVSASAASDSTGITFSAAALAAAGGLKIKKLVGSVFGRTASAGSSPPAAAVAAGPGRPASASAPGGSAPVTALLPARSRGWASALSKLQSGDGESAGSARGNGSGALGRASVQSLVPQLQSIGEESGSEGNPRSARTGAMQDIASALAAAAAAPGSQACGSLSTSAAGSRQVTPRYGGPLEPRLGLLVEEAPKPSAEPEVEAAGNPSGAAPGSVPEVSSGAWEFFEVQVNAEQYFEAAQRSWSSYAQLRLLT